MFAHSIHARRWASVDDVDGLFGEYFVSGCTSQDLFQEWGLILCNGAEILEGFGGVTQ